MLLCFVNAGFGWNVSVVGGASDCASGFVAQSSADFLSAAGSGSSGGAFDISALSTLFNTYFEFDATVFEMILGFNMVAFVTGYSIRRVVRLLSTT